MRKSLVLGLFAAALIMGGCAKKTVEIEAPQEAAPEQATVVHEGEGLAVVSPEEGAGMEAAAVSAQEAKFQKMKAIESEAKKIYFDFDKYNIRPDQQPRVEYDANLFNRDDAKEFNIKVEGNCDEWGTDEYNYALGLKRAKSVRDALVSLGVDANRMTLVSYGESNPVCTEHTRECWRKNRRVEFELLP
ncbi:OmpA family protein [Nitrosophilus alvini]|uniref:OmpA family protein n=1 Tax=Nitrosophilus alvini TaxID=2714855 RepID=UPI00190B4002|nr:OmpA family protein [Nitrosophilus alvini]